MYLPIRKPLGMFVGKVPQDLCINIQSTNTSNAARTLADDLPELLVQYLEHLKSCVVGVQTVLETAYICCRLEWSNTANAAGPE